MNIERLDSPTPDEQRLIYEMVMKDGQYIGEPIDNAAMEMLIARGYVQAYEIVTPLFVLTHEGGEWMNAKAQSDIDTGRIHICYTGDIEK